VIVDVKNVQYSDSVQQSETPGSPNGFLWKAFGYYFQVEKGAEKFQFFDFSTFPLAPKKSYFAPFFPVDRDRRTGFRASSPASPHALREWRATYWRSTLSISDCQPSPVDLK
jgi:hypothetical protein